MDRENTIAALLNAAEKGNGYSFTAHSVKCVNGIVYINVGEPSRTITITERVYDKIKEYIVVVPQKNRDKS